MSRKSKKKVQVTARGLAERTESRKSSAWLTQAGGDYRQPPQGLVWGLGIFLVLLVGIVFGQALGQEFINFDDNDYVYDNPVVLRGLTTTGVYWAFTQVHASNWHPLTWLSHMTDVQIYGLWAGGHHLTNVLLHGVGAVLLFLVFRAMTGALWRSAFVALIFAIHPLHVESVAWVAERKDVLSGVFFMLTLGAYVRYVRSPSWKKYALVVIFFALGLMSKPMLVTLPLLLLLLDYWPLGRWGSKQKLWNLIVEKAPLFALVVLSCVITVLAQGEAVQSFERFSFPLRLGNALVSVCVYVGQMFWPAHLSIFYSYPADGWGVGVVTGAAGVVVFISGLALAQRLRWPWLVVGWGWFLLMLMPVIGLVQVGSQSHADRYTYLPQIGLVLAVAWTMGNRAASYLRGRRWLGFMAGAVVLGLSFVARNQVAVWKNSLSLWNQALACDPDNAVAHNNLGVLCGQVGQWEEAIAHYRIAVRSNPQYVNPENNLGTVLFRAGRVEEAIFHYRKALEINPYYAVAHSSLSNALLSQGQENEALVEAQKAIDLQPNYPEGRFTLGNAFLRKQETAAAVAQYQKAVSLDPNLIGARCNLAWILATSPRASLRDGGQAIRLMEKVALAEDFQDAQSIGTLAAAYAENGRFPEAVRVLGRALVLAHQQGNQSLVAVLETHLKLYRAGQPYRDASQIKEP
jgi:tetratricopeptide (TPR) repeat protein